MIILEGPDGAGKTTLASRVEEILGIKREPRAVTSSAEKIKPIGQYVWDELSKGFGLRLYDRFALISSPMYLSLPEPTFSEELLDRSFLRDMWQRFHNTNPLVILCLPPLEVVRDNVASDKSSQVVWPHIDTIYWSYHNLFCVLLAGGFNVMLYDYTREGGFKTTQETALLNNLRWVKATIDRTEAELQMQMEMSLGD